MKVVVFFFRRWVLMCLVVASVVSKTSAQESILQSRQRPVGSVVTVKGIVLNGSELGAERFVQDSTAGIAVYPGGSSPSSFEQVTRYDEIQVTGVLSMYHGLLEINPILSFQKLSSGNTLPEPVERSINALSFHDQGRLVRIRCVRLITASGNFDSGNHAFYSQRGEKSRIYLDGGSPLINTYIPETTVDMIAIVSHFDEPRFLVRGAQDLEETECFNIIPIPKQSQITQSGFHVSWLSSEAADGFCIVRNAAGVSDTFTTDVLAQQHEHSISGLQPAVFYDIMTGAVNAAGDTAIYPAIPMSTQSTSSGRIAIYFNREVDTAYSNGSSPEGTTFSEMLTSVTDIVADAQSTLDVAMYNSNRPDIIFALEQAMQRGVRVRYIGDGGQSNSALDPLPDFPLLFRDGDGIMHHKFIIADPEDPALAKVWTGSTNHSTNQLSSDPNNTLVIQDQALAKAYLMEFEEMWGGSGNVPNPLLSRTGSAKKDDTPHLFQIGDALVESYFSPSDQTNHQILTELNSAEESIDVALLLLTRYDLTEAMIAKAIDDVRVRVIVDDLESSFGPMQELQAGGVFTAHHDYNSIFHHKYAILDEGTGSARVITGSHNWTTSATVRNDENTLILHDADIANIYRQEFEARWAEVFSSVVTETPEETTRLFPNPSADLIYVQPAKEIATINIYTISGTLVTQVQDTDVIDVTGLNTGMYFLAIENADGQRVFIQFVKE